MDCPVPHSRFSYSLTNKIVQVLLKALLVLQEAHGNVIICFTLVQLCEEDPMGQTPRHENLPASQSGKKTDMSSLVMEGFDVFNVPEDGLLLAADFRWCIRTVCMLQVMEGEEVDIFYELGFPIYQVLDELAGDMKVLVMVCSVVLVVPQ